MIKMSVMMFKAAYLHIIMAVCAHSIANEAAVSCGHYPEWSLESGRKQA